MRITKLGHACVRIEYDGGVVVVDPGGFTEREAVDGATAVLVTHEHADHLDVENLRATDAPVYTIDAVRARIVAEDGAVAERVQVVSPGEQFDALTPAGGPVDLLFLPVHAPWSKISEVIDFSRAVGARRSVAVHDGLLNDTGHGVVGRNLHLLLDTDEHLYERVPPGSDVTL
jgi:hypothetical protein